MLLAMGSVRPLDRLHSEIRKINAPTIQWFQLARPNGVKPGAQGTTKIQAPNLLDTGFKRGSRRALRTSVG